MNNIIAPPEQVNATLDNIAKQNNMNMFSFRKKLEEHSGVPKWITAVRGVGYKFELN